MHPHRLQNLTDFQKLQAAGLLQCPYCGEPERIKLIHADCEPHQMVLACSTCGELQKIAKFQTGVIE